MRPKKRVDRWKVTTRRKDWACILRVAEILRELTYQGERRRTVKIALMLTGDDAAKVVDQP